jgi:flagellar FliL protein
MKNSKLIIGVLLLLVVVLGAGMVWLYMKPAVPGKDKAGKGKEKEVVVVEDTKKYKYLSLEKILVMLRGEPGQPMSHYLSIDLVFKVEEEKEKETKEQLPLLRSVAVKALSEYTMGKASMMTIDQFTADINQAFTKNYAHDHREKPFKDVMIGKLIIE